MWLWIPVSTVRAFSVRVWEPLFLILVWRTGGDAHELCDGYITPGLVIVSYPVTCFCARSEVRRCRGSLKERLLLLRVRRSGRVQLATGLDSRWWKLLVVLSRSHLSFCCRSRLPQGGLALRAYGGWQTHVPAARGTVGTSVPLTWVPMYTARKVAGGERRPHFL